MLLDDVSFELPRGAILGVIGGNGTGKTTLLRMIAGELEPDAGSITLGKSVSLGVVSQSRSELVDKQSFGCLPTGCSDLPDDEEPEEPQKRTSDFRKL